MKKSESLLYFIFNFLLVLLMFPDFGELRNRHGRHHKRTVNGTYIEHKRHKCGIRINSGCACSKTSGILAITCSEANLESVPAFELGIEIVRKLDLSNNKISNIKLGDFYGMKIEKLLLRNNSLNHLNVLAFWGLEYYLETLDVSVNSFYSIPYPSLRLLRHLKSLNLSSNNIKSLGGYGFSSLDKLEVLSLDNNPIVDIDKDAFMGTNLYLLILDDLVLPKGLGSIPTKDLRTLKGLSVARNGIEAIPDRWFSNLTSLKYLKMDDNGLTTLSSVTFRDICLSIRTLELNGNKFRKVPKESIRQLVNLETLRLSGNFIKKINARSFNCSRNLHMLDLSRNKISQVSNAAFHGLDSIQKIDLRDNLLITLDDRLFYWSNVANKEMFLAGNPWLCNCLVKWIKKEYRKQRAIIGMFTDVRQLLCHRPDFLKRVPLVRVPLREFTCDHDYYYYEYVDEAIDEEAETEDYVETTETETVTVGE